MGKKKINPEAILEGTGKQTLQYATLDRMLRDHDFVEARRTGGDHTHYKHEASGITVGVIMGPNTVVYQKAAAQACLDVNAWKERQERERQSRMSERFAAVAKNAEPDAQPTEQAFPAGNAEILTPEGIEDIRVVRLKDRPQIGTIAGARISAQEAQAILTELERQKAEFEPLLREMVERFEFTLKEDSETGTLTLLHEYDADEDPVALAPYDPQRPAPLKLLEETRAENETADADAIPWIRLQTAAAKTLPKTLPDRRLEWTIPLKHFISHDPGEVKLVTTEGGRAASADIFRYLQQTLEFERGSERDPRRLKTILAQTLGANLTLSKTGPQRMIVTHPFEKDPLFEVPMVHLAPSLSKLYEDFIRSTDDQQGIAFTDNIFEVTAQWNDNKKTIVDSLNAFKNRLREAKMKFDSLTALLPGVRMEPGKQAPRKGDFGHNVLRHPAIGAMRIEYLSQGMMQDFNSPTGRSLMIYPNPLDLARLEEKMVEAGLMNGPKAHAGTAGASGLYGLSSADPEP